MTDAALRTAAVLVAAYVYTSLVPVGRAGGKAWHAPALALVPGVAALAVGGAAAGLAALLVAVASAAGLYACRQFASAATWLGVQGTVVLGIAALGAWAAPPSVPAAAAALAVVAAGLVVAVEWGGAFVGRAITPFTDALNPAPRDGVVSDRGLPRGFAAGGKTIGRWERLLIFLFVLAGAPTAIGFLVTAKSILRFGEIKNAESQKEPEYILIGTLMSFGFALVASALTRAALGALAPSLLKALALGP